MYGRIFVRSFAYLFFLVLNLATYAQVVIIFLESKKSFKRRKIAKITFV